MFVFKGTWPPGHTCVKRPARAFHENYMSYEEAES